MNFPLVGESRESSCSARVKRKRLLPVCSGAARSSCQHLSAGMDHKFKMPFRRKCVQCSQDEQLPRSWREEDTPFILRTMILTTPLAKNGCHLPGGQGFISGVKEHVSDLLHIQHIVGGRGQ